MNTTAQIATQNTKTHNAGRSLPHPSEAPLKADLLFEISTLEACIKGLERDSRACLFRSDLEAEIDKGKERLFALHVRAIISFN